MGRFTRSMLLLLLLLFDLLFKPGPFWPCPCWPGPGGPCPPPPPGCVWPPPPMWPWELGLGPWWPPCSAVCTGDIEWGRMDGGDLRSRLYEGCEWTRAGFGLISSINIPPWWWLKGEPEGSSGAKSPRQNDAIEVSVLLQRFLTGKESYQFFHSSNLYFLHTLKKKLTRVYLTNLISAGYSTAQSAFHKHTHADVF